MNDENKQRIREFTDLQAWQAAFKLALNIQEVTKSFPREEVYGITSQIRRSALSATANIAEGFGKQTYKEKVHYYYQAHGSLVETKNHLLLAKGYKYIQEKEFCQLTENMGHAHRLLLGLIRSSKAYLYSHSRI